MKKILFYIHNGWVFGKIHNEAIKHLWPAFACDILDWNYTGSDDEWRYLAEKYDYIVSLPATCFALANRGVPYEKLVGVMHSDYDVSRLMAERYDPGMFSQLRGFAAICPLLVNISLSHGVARIPEILPVGIECRNYQRPMSESVQTLGYMGTYERYDPGFDIKRGCLAKTVAEKAEMQFYSRQDLHFLSIEMAYKPIDVLIFCSLTEGNPYVALEAIAAGIPVLGTAVGLFPSIAKTGAGAVLPFEENALVAQAVEVLQALQTHGGLYKRMHDAALAASQKYDWAVVKDRWIEFFSSL